MGFRHGLKHGVTARPEHSTARLANVPVPAHGTQQAVLAPLPRTAGRHGTTRKSTGGTVRPGGEGRPADQEGGIYKPPSQRPGAPPNPNPHSHSALARRPLDFQSSTLPSRCTPQTLIPSSASSLHLSPPAGGRRLPPSSSCTPSRPPLPDLGDPSDRALSPSPPTDLEILAACLRRRLLPDLGDPVVRALCPGICHRFFSVSSLFLCFSVWYSIAIARFFFSSPVPGSVSV